MPHNTSSNSCSSPDVGFQSSLYAATFTIIFIPGLLANSIALWILCRFISKKNKAIIFMINLAVADLAHVLSLPLRIFYYIKHTWPFGNFLCLLCFYLKYLNLYASIVFLTCISVQRCVFLRNPFKAKDWKRRYDVAISTVVWIVVGAACLPFPIMRSSGLSKNATACFADLGIKKINTLTSVTMLTVAELSGFVVPLIVIVYCTRKTRQFLKNEEHLVKQSNEKQKALKMVLMCAAVFFICFTPYHINFIFYMLVNLNIITHCLISNSSIIFHPFSLCLASINCCLDPVLYYFMASEFRDEISRHGSTVMRRRLMSKESASSVKE
ncbi:putative P2Y purinoceptor 10 [Rhinatrema bivittatum]|uniref:putative P2Y purinoceptor 10 n=1 Tax=Rhinatrema bivittatum TaxID=194408 RepID=UPI001126F7AB|nr:putative P2Y purinoceptor 10 [Rhinatrema bivittatum]XP_029462392.1 putative P2Y purinoceptor 10 [Rhinatrema bivittatum]XP_029462393.1 putative P2Y purinoceptor 10 [Rhinatrema bivittatum]XP_029462395.1 putative P2Y purinoceptor 10 [Rhinatrema bivittatum]